MAKKGRGRPSKYVSHVEPYLDRIPKLRRQGLTEEQIAFKLGVGYTTFKDYKKLYPNLASALKTGRMELIEDLENTLYQKALGTIKVTKVKNTYSRNSRTGEMLLDKKEENIDQLSPDTGALVFALKNLDPGHWADKREYVDTGNFDSSLSLIKDIVNKVDDDET